MFINDTDYAGNGDFCDDHDYFNYDYSDDDKADAYPIVGRVMPVFRDSGSGIGSARCLLCGRKDC